MSCPAIYLSLIGMLFPGLLIGGPKAGSAKKGTKLNREIVMELVKSINEHDVERIIRIMARDSKFIDAHGKESKGRETLRKAFAGYFNWFPDYRVQVDEIMELGNKVAVFGYASATYKGKNPVQKNNRWRLPIVYRAVIENGQVKEWQVYVDTKIPFDIMEGNK